MQQQQISREYFTTRTYPFLVYTPHSKCMYMCRWTNICEKKRYYIHIFGGGSIKLFCAKATLSICIRARCFGRRAPTTAGCVWCVVGDALIHSAAARDMRFEIQSFKLYDVKLDCSLEILARLQNNVIRHKCIYSYECILLAYSELACCVYTYLFCEMFHCAKCIHIWKCEKYEKRAFKYEEYEKLSFVYVNEF